MKIVMNVVKMAMNIGKITTLQHDTNLHVLSSTYFTMLFFTVDIFLRYDSPVGRTVVGHIMRNFSKENNRF